MAKHVVGRVSDIPDGGRVLVTLQGRSMGVFRVNGRFYAVLNRCPHMGAELCRGSILGHLESEVPGEFLHDPSRHLLRCPWHGWEYDLETGQSYFDSRIRPVPVAVERGGLVLAEVDDGVTAPVEPASNGDDPKVAVGLPAPGLVTGPYVAETYPIEVDGEYVVVTLPGRARATSSVGAQ
jgi:nitrite reductase/ring-hydroxylating ferredoxin subunit